jgi:hypothetical protein
MTNVNQRIDRKSAYLEILGHPPIFIQPIYVHALSVSINAALFLTQALYWQHLFTTKFPTETEHGFFQSQNRWQERTGMKRKAQENARRELRELGILKEHRGGLPCRLYYQVDLELLSEKIDDYIANSAVHEFVQEEQEEDISEIPW